MICGCRSESIFSVSSENGLVTICRKGYFQKPADLNLKGANVSEATMQELLAVMPAAWRKETAEMREYLKEFGARAPAEMSAELGEIEKRLA